MCSDWFKYIKAHTEKDKNATPLETYSKSILGSDKCSNLICDPRLYSRTKRVHSNLKSNLKRWIAYCGLFYFFIKYYQLKEIHYNDDIKPIFENWYNLSIDNIDYHSSRFESFSLNMIQRLELLDPDVMGRSHLDGYYYLDDATFGGIRNYIDIYNERLQDFIETTNHLIRTEIFKYSPKLEEYDDNTNRHSDCYYFYNVRRFIWKQFWGENVTLERIQRTPSESALRIQPGEIVIAVGDGESLKVLETCLYSITPNIVRELREIDGHRSKVLNHYENFRRTLYLIMRDIKWNKPLKGGCGWERGFRSIT